MFTIPYATTLFEWRAIICSCSAVIDAKLPKITDISTLAGSSINKRFCKVLEIRSYIDNNLHKNTSIFTPHFQAYQIVLVENGERQEDIEGLYWKKPNNIEAAKAKGCTGWLILNLRNNLKYK